MNVIEALTLLKNLNPASVQIDDDEVDFYFKGKNSYLLISAFYDEDLDKEILFYSINCSVKTRNNVRVFDTDSKTIPLSSLTKGDIEDIIEGYYLVFGTREE